MKMKCVKKVLVPVLLIALFSVFLGCDLAVGGLQMGDVAGRSLESAAASVDTAAKGKGPTYFTATVKLYQDQSNIDTRIMGNSNHYKTVEETLRSDGLIESDWDLLNGKNVVMTNVTNYNLDPGTGEVSGSNHSVIKVVDVTGNVVLTLAANGVLDGSFLGATIDMNWVAKETYGAKLQARGKVTGTFVWIAFDPLTGEVLENIPPNGTFTLSGTYN
ncbi:MAG: hypothetical protein AB7S52_00195 [Sphaerochaetaceae bacterium]